LSFLLFLAPTVYFLLVVISLIILLTGGKLKYGKLIIVNDTMLNGAFKFIVPANLIKPVKLVELNSGHHNYSIVINKSLW
jgi:hypothetical protein